MTKDWTICLNCMINLPIENDDSITCDACGSIVTAKHTNCDPVLDFFQSHLNHSVTAINFAVDIVYPPTTQRWHRMLEPITA